MSDPGALILSLAGTPAGAALAFALALLSALAHAIFGAVNKGGVDTFLNRGAINIAYSLMALPFALFVLPWPTPTLWIALFATYFVHILFEWLQASSFERGAFTLVYPIARGTGPLATAALAIFVFGEHLEPMQWMGLLLLSGAIFSFALINIRSRVLSDQERSGVRLAVLTALATGIGIATYTIVDAYGIRLAENPFTFLAWFFVMGGFGFPIIAYRRWRSLTVRPPLQDLAVRGLFGAFIAYLSFGSIMLATRLDKVGEAAALRETSIIFATAIGVLFFREKVGPRQLGLILLIAAGAMIAEFGG